MHSDCKSLSTLLPKTTALLAEGIEAGWHFGGQLAVAYRGHEYIDAGFGTSLPGEPVHCDDLTIWMSCTKPVSAAAFLLLVDAGQAGLDDPVRRFVPEFAQKGKEGVTVRHLLTHTGGFRSADLGWKPRPWDEAIRLVCEAPLEPRWEPGKSAGYHVDSSWYMLAEIVRRVTGEPFDRFIRHRLLQPWGMPDCFVGIPEDLFPELESRLVRLFNTTRQPPHEHGMFRDPQVAALCRPGGNGRGPARQLARFFEQVLHPERQSVLKPETLLSMRRRNREGLLDKSFRRVIDWGLGVIVNSARYGEGILPYGFGARASHDTFGHGGNQCASALADPDHDLVVVLIFNGQPGEETHQRRMHEALTSIYDDLELA